VWVQKGRRAAVEIAREKAKAILQEHKIEPLSDVTVQEIDRIANEAL
jgi:trimethylamine:corrinoid methyltransferase-like protein